MGTSSEKRMEIPKFMKDYNHFSFEIVDETYGYHTIVYAGYCITSQQRTSD